MGLAPYGVPKYKDIILSELMDLKGDGSLRLNLSYFDFLGGLKMTNNRFAELFGGPARVPETEITQRGNGYCSKHSVRCGRGNA